MLAIEYNKTIEKQENLDVLQCEVAEILVENNKVVAKKSGSVIITATTKEGYQIKETESVISIKTENLKGIKAKINLLSQDIEKYQKLSTNKQILEDNKELMEAEIHSVSEIIGELKESLISYKKVSEEQQSSCNKITKAIEANDEILKKLKEVKTVKTVENFVDWPKISEFFNYCDVSAASLTLADWRAIIKLQNIF